VLFARGEVYRVRDEGADVDKALADLDRASRLLKAPPQTFRSLGLVHKQRSDRGAAVQAFEAYLAQAPDAPDAALVRSYLTELKP
jgi:regulator of sirC expression with transglutaminase-like and TPR domain